MNRVYERSGGDEHDEEWYWRSEDEDGDPPVRVVGRHVEHDGVDGAADCSDYDSGDADQTDRGDCGTAGVEDVDVFAEFELGG